jgi:hypothetical protein
MALNPYDARMWEALGTCYEIMNRNDDALKVFFFFFFFFVIFK